VVDLFEEVKGIKAGKDEDSKLYAAACYAGYVLGLLGFLVSGFVYVTKKNDKYARFHAMQSAVFSLVMFAVAFVVMIPLMILAMIPFVGIISMFGMMVVALVFLGLDLYLAYMAYQGKAFGLPLVADFVLKQI